MIARRLQFDAVKHSVLHPNQLGGISQRSTEDAGLFLTHVVRAGWAKGLKTSVDTFDIAVLPFPQLQYAYCDPSTLWLCRLLSRFLF